MILYVILSLVLYFCLGAMVIRRQVTRVPDFANDMTQLHLFILALFVWPLIALIMCAEWFFKRLQNFVLGDDQS